MRTFSEVEADLPNGLHDAKLHEIRVDREKATLTLVVGVDVSTLSQSRIMARRGIVRVYGLTFLRMDGVLFPLGSSGQGPGSQLASDPLDGQRLKDVHPLPLPAGSFAHGIYLHETNASLSFVGIGAEFEWIE